MSSRGKGDVFSSPGSEAAVSLDLAHGNQASRNLPASSTPTPNGRSSAPASHSAAAALLASQVFPQKLNQCVDAACRDRILKDDAPQDEDDDPPDRMSIGRAAWSFLHSSAATWKDDPATADQHRRGEWLKSFFALFPCVHCRTHFAPYLQTHPPVVSGGRTSLSVWTCEAHNHVNESLQRPAFPCDAAQLIRQWKAVQWSEDDD
ncbi:Erv1 / Alr family protein [Toxoplasma gondii TgCatPRC2]|uniref:Sulfhydryl oxidase n=13 Tax=Toxoplasma gondii TaxID=5811 RepID=B6KKC9_TOXGV|nr:Erv1 / Alr family protein [Toxoplasma gondii ME49]EPR59906.1 Erv1 / Alr family protein [Toxoplasma gondii GT1]ESS33794.1 Erv1 / Alr family protein [Toxoplasma gondii VEG]KAF4644353.1 Erv1 / Alr family protein [Toxoplasma gondii]KFG28882.1 Erv1 / Alr family protein [Toxoplasma gondii p89]KFG42824.1 Erv1 / Alr family protein [Toxoplasma gondii GAB2-2007-GAL-DOM2]KFG53205.1 Erv1 / Alr family protein [Toxoplasma gondii FOU]KFG62584.1 Erv1 / Alr family protein [Toxoplasma gondii RUB]KFH08808.|eukprot:XP_002368302.1 Erv1 / Alr family protein [Toxoplasma gondii ME49]